MHRIKSVLAAVVVLTAVAGCTAPQTAALLDSRESSGLPSHTLIADVPFVPQDQLYCGPAALTMALNASGAITTQQEVGDAIYTPGREGTLRADVVTGARRWGRIAVPVDSLEELLHELAAGNPVIVFQNLSLAIAPQWHFAVAIGYDLDRREIILHSGTIAALRTDLSTFERTWDRGDRWALVVTAPDRLPATATEYEAMTAAAGLERAQQIDAAAQAWQALVARWPQSFGGQMGLGNTRLARQEFVPAIAAYRRAIAIRPEAADAWNNLAYALIGLGNGEAAVKAAETAVRLGGDGSNYRDTLEEIRAATSI